MRQAPEQTNTQGPSYRNRGTEYHSGYTENDVYDNYNEEEPYYEPTEDTLAPQADDQSKYGILEAGRAYPATGPFPESPNQTPLSPFDRQWPTRLASEDISKLSVGDEKNNPFKVMTTLGTSAPQLKRTVKTVGRSPVSKKASPVKSTAAVKVKGEHSKKGKVGKLAKGTFGKRKATARKASRKPPAKRRPEQKDTVEVVCR